MIRISRRAAFRATLTGLLAASAITVGATAASANISGFCSGTGTAAVGNTPAKAANCIIPSKTIGKPATIYFTVNMTSGGAQDVNTTWRAQCTLGSDTATNSGGGTAMTPTTLTLVLPFPAPDSCDVTVSATQAKAGAGSLSVTLSYAPQAGATPTPTPTPTAPSGPTHLYKGFGGKCLDDAGNSSANRAKVQIWSCNSHDRAQGWIYSGGKLVHNGLCANDQRSGGNGSKVILYSCNGGANEIWTHRANGEFVLKANGGKYCLDDPASSTHNGTQLIVWSCKDSANQRWAAAVG